MRAMSLASSGHPHTSVICMHFSMYSGSSMSPCVNTLHRSGCDEFASPRFALLLQFLETLLPFLGISFYKRRLMENILTALS